MIDVLIDSDVGMGTRGCEPEDGLAIAMAIASPEVRLRAVTCVQGNVPVRHAYANAVGLLESLGRTEVPLGAGAERPLLAARREAPLRWLAEKDVVERVLPMVTPPPEDPRAVELILRSARESDGLTIIAIGPLSNVAAALLADPALPSRLERVVVMGGAFDVPGNITPTAEFNFFMDPEAAQVVLDAGVRPVLVGLDVCHQTHLTPRQLAAAGATTAFGRHVRATCAEWLPSGDAGLRDGPHLYDTLAVAAALRPELLTLEPAFAEIDTTTGPGAGTSIAWLPGRWSAWTRPQGDDNALVAVGVDVDGFDALFTERVLAQF